MRAPRQHSQHERGIIRVERFSQDGVIDDNDRVRAEDIILRPALKNRQRLLPRQTHSAFLRRFTRKRAFIDVSGLHGERNPGAAQ